MRTAIFWLLLAVLGVRLFHLDSPIIGYTAWRQADTAAVARNFHENGHDLLRPQIDWGGAGSGYVEMEFPFYSYLVAQAYRLTGVREWWGRLLSALCWTALVAAMHELAAAVAGRRVALWTALFTGFLPLNIFYGRAFMPEAMFLAGLAGSLVFFHRWLERGSWWWLLLSWLGATLACLLKIPNLYIGLPLAYLAFREHGWSFLRKPAILLFAAGLLTVVGLWYRHAFALGQESGNSFGIFYYGVDKWGQWGLLGTWNYWNSILFRSLAERHLTWPGLALVLAGFLFHRRGRNLGVFGAWLVAIFVYLLVVQGGNLAHEYYQLALALPLTFVMALGVDRLLDQGRTGRVAAGLLVLSVALLGVVRLNEYFLVREDPAASCDLALARHISTHTAPHELGVFLNQGNPVVLYLAHRMGWSAGPEPLSRSLVVARAEQGASFLAGAVADVPGDILADWPAVTSEDGRFVVVRLEKKPPSRKKAASSDESSAASGTEP